MTKLKLSVSFKYMLLLTLAIFNQFVSGNNIETELKHIEKNILECIENNIAKADSLCNLMFVKSQYGICLGYYYKGEIAYYQAEWAIATDYYNKSIDCLLNFNDTVRLAAAYNNLGLVLLFQSFYNRSLEAINKSLEYEIKRNNLEGIAQSYQNISMIYENQNKYDIAIEYNIKAIEILKNTNNEIDLAGVFNNLAILYLIDENFKESEIYYQKAKDIYSKNGHLLQEAKVLCNIGSLKVKQGKFDEGREMLERALMLFVLNKDFISEIQAYGMLADLYARKSEYTMAIILSETAHKKAKETDALGLQLQSLYSLYIYNKKTENWKESLQNYEKYIVIKDTLKIGDAIYNDYILENELRHKNSEIEYLNKQLTKIKNIFRNVVIIFLIIGIFLVVCTILRKNKNYC